MKKKLPIFLLFLALSYQISNAQWTKGKNNAYLKLAAWNLNYDQFYNNLGEIEQNTTKQFFNISVYGEYGLTDKLDVVAYLPFYASNTQLKLMENETLNAIGDIDIGFRYAIFKKNNWALAASLKFGLPTGTNNAGSDQSFNTGDGEFNQLLTADLGYSASLNKIPHYTKAYVGFNNRTSNFSDEFRTGIEFGALIFNSKFWVIARLNNVTPLNNEPFVPNNTSQGNIFGNAISYTSYGFEGAYNITKKIGVSLGIDSALGGKNIAASPSINGSIFYDLK